MDSDKYETSDLPFAAYLFCTGTQLTGIDRKNPQRCIFIFDSPAPELISKWQEGKANVNALVYYHSLQKLKAKLFRGEL